MAIGLDSVKAALGDKYDPEGDYLVCGYDQRPMCVAKGYREVGKLQDPSPQDSEMLIFDRKPLEGSRSKFKDKVQGKLSKLLGGDQ